MATETTTTVVTGIKFAQNALTAVNALTFLVDDTWVAGESESSSLPAAFFMVKGQHEIMDSEVSRRTLMFNNSGTTGESNGAITNVVADNIVLQPKQWKLDVMIPYGTKLSPFASYPALRLGQTSGILSGMMEGKDARDFWSTASTLLAGAQTVLDAVNSVWAAVGSVGGATTSLGEMLSVPDYNKRSLEAMWRKRGIYRMKLWNSWRSVHVAITNLDIHKEPTEDNIYEATMTVQEVPILTYRERFGTATASWNNPYLAAAGNALKWLINNTLPFDKEGF